MQTVNDNPNNINNQSKWTAINSIIIIIIIIIIINNNNNNNNNNKKHSPFLFLNSFPISSGALEIRRDRRRRVPFPRLKAL